jgi:hypothetical protein
VTAYRPELREIPPRIRQLKVDQRGYPVPWFVEWVNGVPEFRVMDGHKFVRAIQERRCWVCGEALGRHLAFVVGPMCTVNRTSSEPPCHLTCATWSARFCPFLARPHMVRREDEAISHAKLAGEASLARNPGVAAVWITTHYEVFKAGKASGTGWLITMGTPEQVLWFAEGRGATRAEVIKSLDSGMPALEEACAKENTASERADALTFLRASRVQMEALLPA